MSKRILSATAAAPLAALFLLASAPATAADPFEKVDQSSVSITGEVASASRDSFIFDYGDGFITVRMDDEDMADETGVLEKGERVTVQGEIDDEQYESTTILADTVYSHDDDTWYLVGTPESQSPAEEGASGPPSPEAPDTGDTLRVSGTISTVEDGKLVLSTGSGRMEIDTSEMDNDPADRSGHLQLSPGDVIEVTGRATREFVENREIVAKRIVSMHDTADPGS